MKERLLTDRQQKFVEFYCANGRNAYQAAVDAGYSQNSVHIVAAENLCNPNVNMAIQKVFNKTISVSNIDRNSIMTHINKFIEIATTKKDVNGAAKLIDIMCKMTGQYAPIQINNTGKIIVSFDSDEPMPLAPYEDITDGADTQATTAGMEDFTGGDVDITNEETSNDSNDA